MNQNSDFELIFECFPFGILEKCILGTFSTLEEVSNGTKFSNFGLVKNEIRFFKDLVPKLKFPNLKEMEIFEFSLFL